MMHHIPVLNYGQSEVVRRLQGFARHVGLDLVGADVASEADVGWLGVAFTELESAKHSEASVPTVTAAVDEEDLRRLERWPEELPYSNGMVMCVSRVLDAVRNAVATHVIPLPFRVDTIADVAALHRLLYVECPEELAKLLAEVPPGGLEWLALSAWRTLQAVTGNARLVKGLASESARWAATCVRILEASGLGDGSSAAAKDFGRALRQAGIDRLPGDALALLGRDDLGEYVRSAWAPRPDPPPNTLRASPAKVTAEGSSPQGPFEFLERQDGEAEGAVASPPSLSYELTCDDPLVVRTNATGSYLVARSAAFSRYAQWVGTRVGRGVA